MKHRFSVILHITIAIALIFVMSTSGSAEVEVLNYRARGNYALVDFFNDSNIQIISGFVQVSEEMLKYAAGSPVRPGPMGFLTINIDNRPDNDDDDDYCYGYDCYDYKWGMATIELTSFEVSGSLRSASAEGKGTLIWEQPYYYPYPPGPYPPPIIPPLPPYPPPPPTEEVTIKITWTGESDISSGHNNFRSSYGDIRTHMHSSGTFRYATATGLIKGETFEIEVKPPPPPPPYPTPVPIPEEPPSPPYPPPYPYPYPYPAPYPYSYATIGKSRSGFISIFKL